MNDESVKHKSTFVVGLLGAFLAFSTFKHELSEIKFTVLSQEYSLLQPIILFIVLLALSTYLYALDYLKYSFGKYQNLFLFKAFIPMANFAYSLALLFPLLVFIFWFVSLGPISRFSNEHVRAFAIFDMSAILFFVGGSFLNTYYQTKARLEVFFQKLQTDYSHSLSKALQLFNSNFYNETVIESQKILEQHLRLKLFSEKNLTTKFIPLFKLVEIAVENKLLNKIDAESIGDVVGLRNKAIHSTEQITREQAEFTMYTVRRILKSEVNLDFNE